MKADTGPFTAQAIERDPRDGPQTEHRPGVSCVSIRRDDMSHGKVLSWILSLWILRMC